MHSSGAKGLFIRQHTAPGKIVGYFVGNRNPPWLGAGIEEAQPHLMTAYKVWVAGMICHVLAGHPKEAARQVRASLDLPERKAVRIAVRHPRGGFLRYRATARRCVLEG